MSSASIDDAVTDFLAGRGGSATAGAVVAHLADLGFAASTVRRAADRVVVKSRQGNTFIWSLPAVPTIPDPDSDATDSDRVALEARAFALGIDLNDYNFPVLTDEELQALVEDETEAQACPTPSSRVNRSPKPSDAAQKRPSTSRHY
ncbi:hypothetical protein [Microbacterium sp. C7(2022)]|uniref:hypothetical protein n=1 Tax=Microbacterium sp. C7(2022) TaxID=2992759 RepID=UPI00237A99B7|nr:hypothetical protein [Microbacterium sp. C7(2022)]